MLELFDGTLPSDGPSSVVSLASGSSSDFFLHLHFLAKAVKQKQKVLLVTSRYTESNLRIMCSKLAIRWDPTLVRLIEVGEYLDDDLTAVDQTKKLRETVEQLSAEYPIVLVDDGSLFDHLGASLSDTTEWFGRMSDALPSPAGRLLLSFSHDCPIFRLLARRADAVCRVEPVGAGYGKDVTGTMDVSVVDGKPFPSISRLLYFCGERSLKCFHPGAASVFF